MNNTTCDQAGPLVEAWRDGLLEAAETALVEAHLLECSECAAGPEQELFALAFAEEFRFEPTQGDRWRSVLVQPSGSRQRSQAGLPRFAVAALAAAIAAGALLSLNTSLFGPSNQSAPTGASFGAYGSGSSGEQESPKGRSLTIMSEGDIHLESGDLESGEVAPPEKSPPTDTDTGEVR